MQVNVEKPVLHDIDAMLGLANNYVENGTVIYRDKDEMASTIRSYFIVREGDAIIAMVALNIYSSDLAEVRTLVVHPNYQRQGIGWLLLQSLEQEAKFLGLKELFVLTYQQGFFEKLGFKEINKSQIPNQKIWADCIKCKHFPTCNEVALLKTL